MTARRPPSRTALTRLGGVLLLSLWLLLAQHAGFVHSLSHIGSVSGQTETLTQLKQASDGADADGHGARHTAGRLCDLCLAFNGLASLLHSQQLTPALLSGLGFALVAAAAWALCSLAPPAARNRGPPLPL